MDYEERADLSVATTLLAFVENEALPGTGIDPAKFWAGLSSLVKTHAARNRELLLKRDDLQSQLDRAQGQWSRASLSLDPQLEYLQQIGYLLPEPPAFTITTENVDDELAKVAAPQLVVPVTNARYVLNAANSRWGSLYDALYGTDAISESDGCERGPAYNPRRAAKVIAKGRSFLDTAVPLVSGSHKAATRYFVAGWALQVSLGGRVVELADPGQFAGFRGPKARPESILLRNHGLHIEVRIGSLHDDPAEIADIVLESAVSTIVDFEDSVVTVDAWDKTEAYRVWLGLMHGTLSAEFSKAGKSVVRQLSPDREYQTAQGNSICLPGRSLLLVRNVGLHLYTDSVLDSESRAIPEGILDALLSASIAMHDLRSTSAHRNSRKSSIYIVKPKLHGPEEAAFTAAVMGDVERILGIPTNTIKLGLMDEERRTSVNLAACIYALRDRIAFINTGFLDRTGDEIHTAMQSGPVLRKSAIKGAAWLKAYEQRSVRIGLACGMHQAAQIGKGMWAAPERMADMLEQKRDHPNSGATTAWVPSPTAATLHAIHYHEVDVFARQLQLSADATYNSKRSLRDMLIPPLATTLYADDELRAELDNNVQAILGYVSRWIDHGLGCSKVPDINDVNQMEDRATLRISSQHIANWLSHRVVSRQQVDAALIRMSEVVGRQFGAPMSELAFEAARDLIFLGHRQPNGYTETILSVYRRRAKLVSQTV